MYFILRNHVMFDFRDFSALESQTNSKQYVFLELFHHKKARHLLIHRVRGIYLKFRWSTGDGFP
jgi:hypothetical protein